MRLASFGLGAFDLHAPVGTGGMGQVWRGVHRARQVPVAVKVVHAPATSGRRFTLAFRNEIRQVAKLDHPHVVRILDHGETDEAVEAASGGRLAAGSPYFVMEYASGGSLADFVATPLAWADLREVLGAMLDGLAHAHARGVLHRDLSPRNVLVAGADDPRPGIKLADFGLARGGQGADGLVDGGTPQYLAPEQSAGAVREQGPWTDLYALGCVAWELVAGTPPYAGRNARDLQRQHALAPIPPLVGRVATPPGLEAWLLRLLQKDPAERYRFAADARAGLAAIDDADPADAHGAQDERPLGFSSGVEVSGPLPDGVDAIAPAARLDVVVPSGWREDAGAAGPHPLAGTGLGLYELRTLPLVDRRGPGDLLWNELARVWSDRRPRAVVLRGATGHGKTHLARSIAWRAHELCGAELVAVDHGPLVGPTHGLRQALAEVIGCAGLGSAELVARIDAFLAGRQVADPAWERAALTRYLHGATMVSAEQDALAVRVLGWLGADRPVVVRLDELQWGPETARFARAVLDTPGHLPVLIVATVDTPDLDGVARDGEPLLPGDHPAVTEVDVGPLADEDQHALVRELLQLEPGLAERVVIRTRGNPLFAERLIGDWVRRELLQPTADGYGLVAGVGDVLPDDLHQVWIHAVNRATERHGDDGRLVLHAAGALGVDLHRGEWIDVGQRLGLGAASAVVDDVADALCARGLAAPREPHGWHLAHPLVWESLRRDARDAGRWPAVNTACAEALVARPDAHRQLDRIGLHRFSAGDYDGCVQPLLAGAERCADTGELPAAAELLARRDEALTALEVGPGDPRWGDGRLVRLRVLVGRGAFAEAQTVGQALAEAARRYGWRQVAPEALRYLGLAQLKLGRLLEAEAMLALAEATASGVDTVEARRTIARCGVLRITLNRIRGARDEAMAAFARARAQFEAIGDGLGVADATMEAANAELTLGTDLDAAEQATERAKRLHEALDNLVGVAVCVNSLGEIHRRRGDWAAAERDYRWALTAFDRAGSDARLFPRLNLGIVLLHQSAERDLADAVADADRWFAEAEQLIEASGRAGLVAPARILRMPGAARRGDGGAFDLGLAAVDALPGRPDPDLAWVLGLAASIAASNGDSARADSARALAARLAGFVGGPHPEG